MKGHADRQARSLYGGVLTGQGAGMFVALELLAIAKGVRLAGLQLLDRSEPRLRYVRTGLDFAQRLAHNPNRIDVADLPFEPEFLDSAVGIADSVVVGEPRRTGDQFGAISFLPVESGLIHSDVVFRNGSPKFERYSRRGAGALAYSILRNDPDDDRRSRIADRLSEIVDEEPGRPLNKVFEVFRSRSRESGDTSSSPFEEGTIPIDDARFLDRASVEAMRSGTQRVLESTRARTERTWDLMRWITYALTFVQLDLAAESLGIETGLERSVDLTGRRATRLDARRDFERHRAWIVRASHQWTVEEQQRAVAAGNERRALSLEKMLQRTSNSWKIGPAAWYARSLHDVGGLNANTGLRHYRLTPDLVETLVAALLDEETPFDHFVELVLPTHTGIVIAPLDLPSADRRVNLDAFEHLLDDLGMLRSLSDSTRMVRTHDAR